MVFFSVPQESNLAPTLSTIYAGINNEHCLIPLNNLRFLLTFIIQFYLYTTPNEKKKQAKTSNNDVTFLERINNKSRDDAYIYIYISS